MGINFFRWNIYRIQKTTENGSMPNKSRKKNEEKININIFLAHNVPELELGSDSESGVKTVWIDGLLSLLNMDNFQFSILFFFVNMCAFCLSN